MSEDQRVGRNQGEPTKTGPGGAERWIGYLDWLRAEVRDGVLALSPAEQRWFVWGFLGDQVAEPWGDWNTDEPWLSDDADATRPSARWTVAAEYARHAGHLDIAAELGGA